ncbi:hypothetical protein JCM12178A_27900 [Salidesulfovibrio brasiliensis]
MQKRYCSCGNPVHVQYINRGARRRLLFWAFAREGGATTCTCPHCRRTLNINELR